jgi:hypothetical protein
MFLKKTIQKSVPVVTSIIIACSIEEFTVPLINSKLPIDARPQRVIPVDKQIYCRAEEWGSFLELNSKIASPSINIAVLLQRIEVASDDCVPNPFIKDTGFSNNWKKRNRKSAEVIRQAILNSFMIYLVLVIAGKPKQIAGIKQTAIIIIEPGILKPK